MPQYNNRCKSLFIAFMFCILLIQITFAVTMDFIVYVPKIVTDGTVTQFDIFGEGVGAQIFSIILNNTSQDTAKGLTLTYYVDYYPPNSSKTPLYKGVSNTFHILHSPRPDSTYHNISSGDFLKKNNPKVKASLTRDEYELPDGELKDKIHASQKMPDGIVRYTMHLKGNGVNIVKYSDHTIINASSITLISPGTEPSSPVITITDAYPVFTWASDLVSSINQDPFEIRVYEARSGESYTEAMSRRPVMQERTSSFSFKYPYTGHQLQSGFSYYWEVVGFPNNQQTEELKSSPFGFRLIKAVNPKVLDVVNILKMYPQEYTVEVLNKIAAYDSDVTIRISGEGKTEEISTYELRELIGKFITGDNEVTSTTVY